MNLNDQQKSELKSWVSEGNTLSAIQTLIQKEWGKSLTYMETRFLVDDLGLDLPDLSPSSDSSDAVIETLDKAEEDPIPFDPHATSTPDAVNVSVDKVKRPGTLISGNVTFSDGISGSWHLDSLGRIALSPSQEGYNPSQDDLQKFQKTLQEELQRTGF